MDDLISRQAAINTVMNIQQKCDTNDIDEYRDILVECFEELPTAEKKGKWIDYCGGVKCDQCGFECDDPYYLGEANFCPNCGSRMEESE